jgi:hypothetical protein
VNFVNQCPACGGDGFVTTTTTVHGHPYPALKPCGCSAGQSRRDLLEQIAASNDAEIDRLGYRRPDKVAPPPPRREPVL